MTKENFLKPILKFYLSDEAKEKGISLVIPKLGDAGFDIRSLNDVEIQPNEQVLVSTGLYVAVPLGYVMIIKDRSGMAAKRRIYTHAGVIDASYRGEVKIVVTNESNETQKLLQGEKIAQGVVVPCVVDATQEETLEVLGDTERGAGGFGSSGKF